ncbi:MAG: 2-phospho-L-lactate guanylyltransferase [Anaerolineae bacterium]|nr:2-phospho-L-lactate guanylyltransferase [Anaerolineae bacterium]
MSTWAIVPVKPLRRAKSRLADVLSPEQRRLLAERMLRHVLQVVQTAPQILGTLVISRDSEALAIAREYDLRTVQEAGSPELNAALGRATQVVAGWGGDSVLVLPADLPLLEAKDLGALIDRGSEGPCVVIATDAQRDGTNALFMRPPGAIGFAYGEGSFSRHRQLAHAAGIRLREFHSSTLALDIDVAADLQQYFRYIEEMPSLAREGDMHE